MCARAMANFGLDDLRLVNPRQGWPRTDEYREVAYSAAAGATDLLDAAKVFPSVEAAVGDLHSGLRGDGARARADEGGLDPERRHGRDRGGDRREARHPVRAGAHRIGQ